MAEGLTIELLWTSCIVWLLSFWIISRYLSIYTSMLVTTLKVLIPLLYFAFFYDGSWNFLDDLKYTYISSYILEVGYNPISVLFDSEGLAKLSDLTKSTHLGYYWWNIFAQYIFGKYYYSAVFLNVVLTSICGYFICKIAEISTFKKNYIRFLFLFLLLHLEINTWSSFINLKDPLVMTLTVIFLYLCINFTKKINYYDVAWSLIIVIVLFNVRFYIPIMLILSLTIWLIMNNKGRKKYFLSGLVIVAALIIFALKSQLIIGSFNRLDLDVKVLVSGTFRMLLTPQPWSLEDRYSFLFVPSIFHWILFVPALLGGCMLWRRSKKVALLLIYFTLVVLLYGSFDELQGPRHRLQITPIIAWAQFHFLWLLLVKPLQKLQKNIL